MNEGERLISGYFDATLADTEVAQLETLLLADSAYASLFARFAILHSAIRDAVQVARSMVDMPGATEAADAQQPFAGADPAATLRGLTPNLPDEAADETMSLPVQAPIPLKKPRRFPPGTFGRRSALAAAISLLSGTALVLLLQHRWSSPEPIAMGPSLDAIWSDPASVPAPGGLFKTGASQSLESGCVELTSADGLMVVIQGPATFTAEKAGVISLTTGRLTASVPKPARGFTVNTPVAGVVDLGTEFGVAVSLAGDTDVQTFRGTVSLSSTSAPASSASSLITAGLARRVSSSGQVTAIPANLTAFVRPQQFEDWNAMSRGTSYERWQAYSQRLRSDPDLVAYYTFDKSDAAPERLLNSAASGAALDGVLLGTDRSHERPVWTTGRWPQKGALSFLAETHERVEIPTVPGGPLDFSRRDQIASPFTICIWLCADGQRQVHSSILLHGVGAEQIGMELFADRSIEASVGKVNVGARQNPALRITNSWQQLTLDYDPDHRTLALYVNGELVARNPNASATLPQVNAPIAIGNREYRGRLASYLPPMVGRIDEFAVFRRALSAGQIKQMYLAEKPE